MTRENPHAVELGRSTQRVDENGKDIRAVELPEVILARWDAEDWDDRTMTASRYRYEDQDGNPIELTEEQANLYSWGQCEDNLTGGSQSGRLAEVR
jgi:hypothetical protein